MYIILKTSIAEPVVVGVICCESVSYIDNWVSNYLNEQNTNLVWEIHSTLEDTNREYVVFEVVTETKRGYIYNSTKSVQKELFKLTILPVQSSTVDISNSELYNGINGEIINRTIKSMDRDSLVQFIKKQNAIIKGKEQVSYSELVELQKDMLYHFNKKLYSQVANRLKRYGKVKKE